MDNNFYTVSDVANMIGVSIDTIRRWEKKGLIKAKRSNKNYRVFNIDEIERIHNKVNGIHTSNNYKILKEKNASIYTVIELFAGAGGTALGMENAGLRHIFLNDSDKDSIATLKRNRPKWNVVLGDVREINFNGMYAKSFHCHALINLERFPPLQS